MALMVKHLLILLILILLIQLNGTFWNHYIFRIHLMELITFMILCNKWILLYIILRMKSVGILLIIISMILMEVQMIQLHMLYLLMLHPKMLLVPLEHLSMNFISNKWLIIWICNWTYKVIHSPYLWKSKDSLQLLEELSHLFCLLCHIWWSQNH